MAVTAAPQAYTRVRRRTVAPAKGKPFFEADMEVASLDAAQVAKLPRCDSRHGAVRQWSSWSAAHENEPTSPVPRRFGELRHVMDGVDKSRKKKSNRPFPAAHGL